MEKINCIFWGVNENKIRKQNPITNMHIDETFRQSIPLGIPSNTKTTTKSLLPLCDQKTHFFLSTQQLLSLAFKDHGKRGSKKETETNISWYSSVYERNVIPSKPNQKLYIFSLAFYYFFHFIPSLNTSLKYSDSYNLF